MRRYSAAIFISLFLGIALALIGSAMPEGIPWQIYGLGILMWFGATVFFIATTL
jgi:hypothetical protein